MHCKNCGTKVPIKDLRTGCDLLHVDDVFDLAELAEAIGITYDTARTYKAQGALPEPTLTIGKSPLWDKRTILKSSKHNVSNRD